MVIRRRRRGALGRLGAIGLGAIGGAGGGPLGMAIGALGGIARGIAAPSRRRRPRRIVFSENQWSFVRSLMKMVGGRAPGFPSRRRRRRRGGF